jgi:hypothetical protein
MSKSSILGIFIDTSFLRGESHKNPQLQEIFELSKNRSVDIYISKIALEEWRTQKAEELVSQIRSAETAINRAWSRNIIAENFPNPNDRFSYPAEEVIKEESKKRIDTFINDNKINVLNCTKEHTDSVLEDYFECNAPFNPDQQRENRRKDIPDAWIYQAAIDVYQDHDDFIVLCRDSNLSSVLSSLGENVTVYENAKEVLGHIETDVIEEEKPPEISTIDVLPATADEANNLLDSLKLLRDKNIELEVRILGYINWFDPVSKEDLYKLLAAKGYHDSIVENTAQRLTHAGIIRDTGHHYLPDNIDLCEEAAQQIMNEILEMVSQ